MTVHSKVLLAATSFLALSTAAFSQANHARIVRISYAEGTVQLNNQNIVINTPVVEGSVLTTGDDGFAEVQFEAGSILRVGPNTEVTFSQLARLSWGETLTRLDLDAGEAELTLNGGPTGQFAIGAANKNIQVGKTGRFRVFRSKDEPLELAVWKGEAVVHDSESGADVTVGAQETFVLAADDPEKYELQAGVEADGLDEFSQLRDEYLAREYVSNDQDATVVSPSGFVDPCAPLYWSGLPNCYGLFPYPPIEYGVVYLPPYYRHPHHRHPPVIHPPVVAQPHPPVLAQPVPVKVLRPPSPGTPIRTGRVEPGKPPVRLFGDDNFQRSTPSPPEDHQKTVVVGEPVRVEPGKPAHRGLSDENFQRGTPSAEERGERTAVSGKTPSVEESPRAAHEAENGSPRPERVQVVHPHDSEHAPADSGSHSTHASSATPAGPARSDSGASSHATYSSTASRSDSGSSSHSSSGYSGGGMSHSGGATAAPAASSASASHSSAPSSPPSSPSSSGSSGRSH